MRISILTALSVALCFSAPAEAKCKWAKAKDNHYKTKRVVASTMWKGMAMHLGHHEGEYYVLGYMQSLGKRASFDEETPMVFVFEDGHKAQVLPLEDSSARRTALGLLLNNRKSETMYTASKETISALAEQRLAAIELHYRVNDGLQVHTFPFGKGNGKKLVRFASCLVEHSEPNES